MKAEPPNPGRADAPHRRRYAGAGEKGTGGQGEELSNPQHLREKGGILFAGSSLMEQFPVCELAMDAGITRPVYNRGIGGTTTDDFLREIDTVLLDLEPLKVFLNIGTNDMTDRIYGEKWMEHLAENYEAILRIARENCPTLKSSAWPIIPQIGICRIRTNGRRLCSRSARWRISQLAMRVSKRWQKNTAANTST